VKQGLTILAAVVLIAAGYALYARSADRYASCQSTLGGIVRQLDPASGRDCADVKNQHFGSIALMGLGGIVLLLGIFVSRPRS
jgi:hypothetical protein